METTAAPTLLQSFNSLFDFFDDIDKDWLFQVIIGFVTLMFLWENYLSYRQVKQNTFIIQIKFLLLLILLFKSIVFKKQTKKFQKS